MKTVYVNIEPELYGYAMRAGHKVTKFRTVAGGRRLCDVDGKPMESSAVAQFLRERYEFIHVDGRKRIL